MTESEEQPKKFHIQRKRLGVIRYVREDGEFGFIEAEDFREDVFFHRTTWQAPEGRVPQEKMHVEYELDEEHREKADQLRAKIVRMTRRPAGKNCRVVTHRTWSICTTPTRDKNVRRGGTKIRSHAVAGVRTAFSSTV